jgi:hypothetical protein
MRGTGRSVLLLGGFLLLLDGCSIPLRETLAKAVTEHQTPRAAVSAASGTGIAADTAITVTYTKTMDPDSLALGGTMGGERAAASWSETDNPSDTLTIKPVKAWPTVKDVGALATLTVECSDPEGWESPKLSLTYGILDGIVYVSQKKGKDANPGTAALPKLSIVRAISTAAAVFKKAEVHVAAGGYDFDSQSSGQIELVPGISLYGGYSAADWAAPRDPAANETTISDVAASGSPMLMAGSYLPSTTVVDGFIFSPGGGSASVAILIVSGSPVIRNNTITLGPAVTPYGIVVADNSSALIEDNLIQCQTSTGSARIIAVNESTPVIRNNRIKSTSANDLWCILNTASASEITGNTFTMGNISGDGICIANENGSDALIRNNTIDNGFGSPVNTDGQCIAISNHASSPRIQNNTILAGTWASSAMGTDSCIANYLDSHPVIQNNLIFASSTKPAEENWGIWEFGTNAWPADCSNNYFSGFAGSLDALYITDAPEFYATVADMELYLAGKGSAASSNVDGADDPPAVLDTDWDITVGTPASITLGGKNLSSEFTTDKAGNPRPSTGAWSIGAYQ